MKTTMALVSIAASAALASMACSAGNGDDLASTPRNGVAEATFIAPSSAPSSLAVTRQPGTDEVGEPSPEPVPSRAARWSIALGGVAAALDPDGNVDVAAPTHLFEVDPGGLVRWDVAWDPPPGEADRVKTVATTPSGWVVVSGSWTRDDGTSGFFAHAFDSDGSARWERRWDDGTAGYGAGVGALAVRDHAVAITAHAGTYLLDCDGRAIWAAPVGGDVVAFAPDGDVIVGRTNALAQREVLRLGARDGVAAWSTSLEPVPYRAASRLTAMVVDDAGAAYVAGERRFLSRPEAPFAQWESLGARVEASGEAAWQRVTDLEGLTAAALGDAGRITFAGAYASTNTPSLRPMHVRQLDTEGTLLWQWVSPRSLPYDEQPVLVTRAGGGVYTAARFDGDPSPDEVRAHASDGSVSWQATDVRGGAVRSILADARGVVLVADFAVARFDP